MSTDLASQRLASCLQSARFNTFTSDGVKNISVSSSCDGGRKEEASSTSQTSTELNMTHVSDPGQRGENLDLCHRSERRRERADSLRVQSSCLQTEKSSSIVHPAAFHHMGSPSLIDIQEKEDLTKTCFLFISLHRGCVSIKLLNAIQGRDYLKK